MRCKLLVLILLVILSVNLIYAHGNEIEEKTYLKELLIGVSVITLSAALLSVKKKKLKNNEKIFLFAVISVPILIVTFYLAYSTVKLNLDSDTKGPVHWHADIEFWVCGKKLDLKDPEGLFNRVGNPVFHEHNDDRIHVEGVVKDLSKVSLHNFFGVVGLEIEETYFKFHDAKLGEVVAENCNGEKAKTQFFLYKIINPEDTKNWVYKLEKTNEEYIISKHQTVPPGDCIIIEFDEEKQTTSHICESYNVPVKNGELRGS